MDIFQRWKQTSVANKLLVYTGVLVAFGTLFYAGAAVFQICLMKENARETAKQNDKLIMEAKRIAETMEENNHQNKIALDASLKQSQKALDVSIENARLDQRAWIVIKDVKFEHALTVGEVNSFSLTFLNTGKTPAQNVRFKYTSRVHVPGKPDSVKAVPSDEELSLGPEAKFVVRGFTEPPRLNEADVVGFESGTIVFTLFIEVTYHDVFQKKLHKTTYCGFYKPENKPHFTLCNSGNHME
jgi:hypothetical protein